MTILVDLLFASVVLTVGASAGWWLRGRRSEPPHNLENESQRQLASETLARLHELAAGVAADVGKHNSQVQEINEELNAHSHAEAEDVAVLVTKLVQANAGMQQQLDSAERKLQEQARQIETHAADARTDALTGLANRRAFDDETARHQQEFARHGQPVSLMLFDVDHFKKLNDTYGHQAGDQVLRGVAATLQQVLGHVGLVARYGGEEFAVVLAGTSGKEAGRLAQQTCQAIAAAQFPFQGRNYQVTASGGLAQLARNEAIEATIRRADEALYAAKSGGRNRVYWHDGQQLHQVAAAGIQPPPTPAEPVPETEEQLLAMAQHQADQLQREVGQAASTAERQEKAASVDPQTGLLTQALFRQKLEFHLEARRRGKPSLSGLLVRVDAFSHLEAFQGPEIADMVLRAATQFLKTAVRSADQLARYDEETFGVLLPTSNLKEVTALAERLRKAVARCRLPLEDTSLHFTVSIGLAEAAAQERSDSFLERLETALQAALTHGSNCTYIHDGRGCKQADLGPEVGSSA